MAFFTKKKEKDIDDRATITLRELTIQQAFDVGDGKVDGGSPQEETRNLFISDPLTVRDRLLREYDIWYGANADEILNFYTEGMAFSFATEPWYGRNMRNCFWARSSTESDIVRVHSNLGRSAIDTLSSIIGRPTVSVSIPEDNLESFTVRNPAEGQNPSGYKAEIDRTKELNEILDANSFWDIYERQKQRTLALGWGCYKLDAVPSIFDEPIITYYDANDVDFVKRGNRVVCIMFRDWVIDAEGRRICIVETRTLKKEGMMLEIKAYRQMPSGNGGDAVLTPLSEEEMNGIPALRGVNKSVLFEGSKDLFAYPTIYIDEDSEMGKASNMPGRSILAGRICILDDIDQALSQKANSIRKSTPVEYFNTDFLERDLTTGLPIMPKNFDRKYTSFHGGKNADGTSLSSEPVQVTQPNINFSLYDQAAVEGVKFFLHGWMSPATMGIDVSKQSTQESQREKEKITLFTKQKFSGRDQRTLEALFRGTLCLNEWIKTKKITKTDYDISVKFPDFADSSFEDRLTVLSDALAATAISPKEYIHRLYQGELKGNDYDEELAYLMKTHNPDQADASGQDDMMAALMGGAEEGEGPEGDRANANDQRMAMPGMGER